MQSQAKLIHSTNKYPLPLLCADIVPSTGDTTGTKHSLSHVAVEKTTRIQLSKQIHDGMTTAKQKLRWPERKGRRDGGRACCAERLPETDCGESEVERTSWALKQSIQGGSEESQGARKAGGLCEGYEAGLEQACN